MTKLKLYIHPDQYQSLSTKVQRQINELYDVTHERSAGVLWTQLIDDKSVEAELGPAHFIDLTLLD